MESTIISLGICVALPVLIVWLVTRVSVNRDNQKTAVLLEALKGNNPIDVDTIAKTLAATGKSPKTPLERNNLYLLCGCIFSLLGLTAAIICSLIWIEAGFDCDGVGISIAVSGICFALGISYLIVYFVTKKQLKENGNLLHE